MKENPCRKGTATNSIENIEQQSLIYKNESNNKLYPKWTEQQSSNNKERENLIKCKHTATIK